MRRGYRWMYHETGLPGWMRYGQAGPGFWHGHGWWCRGGAPWEYGPEPYRTGHWWGPPTAQEEQDALREEAEDLKRYLEHIERRISELDKQEQD